jgi:hypothetical protein
MNKKSVATQATAPAEATTSDDDPIGSCQYTNASGQPVCLDNVRKSECDQILNSIFIEGGVVRVRTYSSEQTAQFGSYLHTRTDNKRRIRSNISGSLGPGNTCQKTFGFVGFTPEKFAAYDGIVACRRFQSSASSLIATASASNTDVAP